MTQEAQEWQDELADIVTDSLDIDWNANVCAGHLLANGVYPPSVVAELVEAARDGLDALQSARAFILKKHGSKNPHREQAIADLTAAIAKLEASK